MWAEDKKMMLKITKLERELHPNKTKLWPTSAINQIWNIDIQAEFNFHLWVWQFHFQNNISNSNISLLNELMINDNSL